jgi:hypothetical protein
VQVYDTSSSSNYITYTRLSEAVTIDANSTVYSIREAPNGFYELNFGDGISFGKKPDAGNKVVVTYLSSVGPVANSGDIFTSNSNLTVGGIGYTVSASTSNESAGGALRQSIESVRQLAPIAYAAQQRLVTSSDYKATILSNFSEVNDCNVWSGDQNYPIDYGAVYVSLNFPAGTSQTTKDVVKANIVTNFTDNLSVVSMTTKFTDPTDVFLELNTQFDYDPARSGITLAGTETGVYNYIIGYFNRNLNSFNSIFRRSNLLTEIDALDQAILSSRIDLKVQLRIEPTIGSEDNFELAFPMKIASPDDQIYSVTSSIFEFNGAVCQIKNVLNGTRLQIIDIDNNVLLDNVGEYKPLDGEVNIIGFAPDAFIGGNQFIKISVLPDNPSVIRPLRNYVLRLDTSESSATATADRQTTSLQVT